MRNSFLREVDDDGFACVSMCKALDRINAHASKLIKNLGCSIGGPDGLLDEIQGLRKSNHKMNMSLLAGRGGRVDSLRKTTRVL